MSPAQDRVWDKWMETQYSGLYWQYMASRLNGIATALNLISALTGASAVLVLVTDYPLLTKLVALIASALSILLSYSGVGSGLEKAKVRADFYSKLTPRYEQLWKRINQALDEESIAGELNRLLEAETLLPAATDEKYDDRLRERVYKILLESKGLSVPNP
jgi:hypothetical protein